MKLLKKAGLIFLGLFVIQAALADEFIGAAIKVTITNNTGNTLSLIQPANVSAGSICDDQSCVAMYPGTTSTLLKPGNAASYQTAAQITSVATYSETFIYGIAVNPSGVVGCSLTVTCNVALWSNGKTYCSNVSAVASLYATGSYDPKYVPICYAPASYTPANPAASDYEAEISYKINQ